MFYYSQFKANKNMQKQQDQRMTDVSYTTPATRNTRGTSARVAYQVRTTTTAPVTVTVKRYRRVIPAQLSSVN